MKTIFIILMLMCASINMNEAHVIVKETKLEVKIKELSIEDSVRLVLSEKNLSSYTVELLIAQSKHESGNYRNSLSRLHKNIFSRHYEKIDTLSLGAGGSAEGHNRFARYKSIKDATNSQYAYLKRRGYTFSWNTPREFAIELKNKRYYEDSIDNYSRALSKLIKQQKHDLDTLVSIYN